MHSKVNVENNIGWNPTTRHERNLTGTSALLTHLDALFVGQDVCVYMAAIVNPTGSTVQISRGFRNKDCPIIAYRQWRVSWSQCSRKYSTCELAALKGHTLFCGRREEKVGLVRTKGNSHSQRVILIHRVKTRNIFQLAVTRSYQLQSLGLVQSTSCGPGKQRFYIEHLFREPDQSTF